METSTLVLPSLDSGMRPHRWTREEFEHLEEIGAIQEDDRVELIHGIIVDRPMPGPQHTHLARRVEKCLSEVIGDGLDFWNEKNLAMGDRSSVIPDIAVVPLTELEDWSKHPRHAELVVEISDSSLHTDRLDKLMVYAAGGVPEYWILNVKDRQLEVYRQPIPEERRFDEQTILKAGDTITPLCAPEAVLHVTDILPGAAA